MNTQTKTPIANPSQVPSLDAVHGGLVASARDANLFS